ncbi:sensor histidine kinase [Chryseobacterium gregarium]|uniref:sensor histidine kinase n=1 Tax=Chryseobacterium gregarium TaxID=456299 RepID=UPI000424568F|nr:HAMP domain-containing sensor histidine kinase [Chryseobacterium gregarium]
MKPLLSKTTKPFLIYVLVILVISIPVYYWVIDQIWQAELDEHNKTIAQKTAYEFNHLKLTDTELEKSITLWNRIQPETDIKKVKGDALQSDIYSTVEKIKPFAQEPEIERYRKLQTMVYLNNSPFIFTIQTNIEETEETVAVIALTTVFFFIMIVMGLLILNRRLSESIWKPFRSTLEKLKVFNLNHQENLAFEKTDILEFEELHRSLYALIAQNISVFRVQKEFTENASHELQTPLAIIKQKLDLLLQDKNLTKDQYHIAEDIHRALSRSSRINKNLLLLAKIDNSQFNKSENVQLSLLTEQSLELLAEHFHHKKIAIQSDIHPGISTRGNSDLTEILITNLLMNSIRYTVRYGYISITLKDGLLQISNTGNEPLDHRQLFKRFSGNTLKGGTGLGLAIIKEICVFHHWNIDYRFENNRHIFTVTM